MLIFFTLMSLLERTYQSFLPMLPSPPPPPPPPVSILHIYTAKGLREYAYAAAEKLRDLDKLDAKEHKGKVRTSAGGRSVISSGPRCKTFGSQLYELKIQNN